MTAGAQRCSVAPPGRFSPRDSASTFQLSKCVSYERQGGNSTKGEEPGASTHVPTAGVPDFVHRPRTQQDARGCGSLSKRVLPAQLVRIPPGPRSLQQGAQAAQLLPGLRHGRVSSTPRCTGQLCGARTQRGRKEAAPAVSPAGDTACQV